MADVKFTILELDPATLQPNPWNTNHLSPQAETKLETSLLRHDGLFKPIITRTLPDGKRQILGGQHRAAAAERLGMKPIPVMDLGEMTEDRAKEISLIDNGRYGQDDALELSRLLNELGSPAEMATFMPFDLAEMETMSAMSKIDLDALDDLTNEAAPVVERPVRAPKTHAQMRFKVPVEDQGTLGAAFSQIIKDQGLADSDSLVNAGDALMWLVGRWRELETGA